MSNGWELLKDLKEAIEVAIADLDDKEHKKASKVLAKAVQIIEDCGESSLGRVNELSAELAVLNFSDDQKPVMKQLMKVLLGQGLTASLAEGEIRG